jgi:hypothetical protein
VAVPEAVDRDARERVDVFLPLDVPDACADAVRQRDGQAVVCREIVLPVECQKFFV